ncbi:MAG: hypothetical protein WAN93_14460 [Solirubrobacteraceae bacterium]
MSNLEEIFVSLLNEAVDVWRPVQAEPLHDNVYRIIDQPYNREIETWQFEPGDEVVCELTESSDGQIRAATRRAD